MIPAYRGHQIRTVKTRGAESWDVYVTETHDHGWGYTSPEAAIEAAKRSIDWKLDILGDKS